MRGDEEKMNITVITVITAVYKESVLVVRADIHL